jgi:hypothetical protein
MTDPFRVDGSCAAAFVVIVAVVGFAHGSDNPSLVVLLFGLIHWTLCIFVFAGGVKARTQTSVQGNHATDV